MDLEGRGNRFDFTQKKDQSAAEEKIQFWLNQEGINLPEELGERLMLLDTKRRVIGELKHSVRGIGHDGAEVDKEIGTHLEHTANLIEVLDIWLKFFPEEWVEKYRKKIISAAVIHDIGKTGPAEADLEAQEAYSKLFSFYEPDKDAGKNFHNVTVFDAINKHGLTNETEQTISALRKIGFTEKTKMEEVFAGHLDNSYSILKNIPNFDPEILYLVSSHHRGLHNYPYHLTDQQIDDLLIGKKTKRKKELQEAATLIELADVFEARSSRGEQKDPTVILPLMLETYKGKREELERELNNPDTTLERKNVLEKQRQFVVDAAILINKMVRFYPKEK